VRNLRGCLPGPRPGRRRSEKWGKTM